MSESHDDFYTGYLPEAPSGIAAHVRRVIAALMAVTVAVALILIFGQQGFSSAAYEWLVFRDFEGVVRETPYPMLEVGRPLSSAGERSRLYLVAPGKLGVAAEVAGLDGRRVRLQGSLLYRDDQTMIEVVPGSIEAGDTATAASPEIALGTHTLSGRIVGSKCFLGIMKPGSTKPHRACATRCISGGIPPLLVVEDERGTAAHLLLVGTDGRAVNAEVLGMVDEPVEITGEVVRRDDLLVLYADPATYRRLT
ncbi:MAG: hypothetical protein V3T72_15160 [Thermoanaerobaculia bacterium]